jgi:hypothetical protein
MKRVTILHIHLRDRKDVFSKPEQSYHRQFAYICLILNLFTFYY